MTANMQQNVQQQTELMIRQQKKEFDDKKQEYEQFRKKQKRYIMHYTKIIAVHISQNFAKKTAEHQNKLIIRSYNELNFENIAKEMEEKNDEFSI